jgi:hypothetical protein
MVVPEYFPFYLGEGLCTQTPIRKVTVEKDPARPALVLPLQVPTSRPIMHALVQILDLYFFSIEVDSDPMRII